MLKFLLLLLVFNFNLSPFMHADHSNTPKIAEYGSWESPIPPEMIGKGSLKIGEMKVDGDFTYWTELRPQNKGLSTLVRLDDKGNRLDMTPSDFNVRTFVHEYGGGAFTVSNGTIYASNGKDNKIYVIPNGEAPQALTDGTVRFADLQLSPYGLIAVGESHAADKTVENFLALIDLSTGHFQKLAYGHDFYSSPAISPDGKKIVFLSWDHPNMPWTHTELWEADFHSGKLSNLHRVAGEYNEAIFEPQWAQDNTLYFVSDRISGWWNLYHYQNGKVENVCPIKAEVGVPGWLFGFSTYAFLGDKIIFGFNSEGLWHLGVLDPKKRVYHELKVNGGNSIRDVRSGKDFVRLIEGYPDQNEKILQIDKPSQEGVHVLFETPNKLDSKYISLPEHVTYKSGNHYAHGFYYPPKNGDFKGPHGKKPPLVVMIHGGPTAQSNGSFQMSRQFWTTRGFAVLDVNYGGSTGYGREYRDLLNHNWGIVDVEDCVNGAEYLVKKGLADPDKLVIRGSSAGGYTTLAALTFHHVFKAGASYYGIADISALAHDTHKFESKYMELLMGPYPQDKHVWDERSPINSVEKLKSPLIIFQGENDPIVPKNQATMIYDALKAQNVQTELYIYPGEEHGFRQSEHIVHSLQRELDFYKEVFKIS